MSYNLFSKVQLPVGRYDPAAAPPPCSSSRRGGPEICSSQNEEIKMMLPEKRD